MEISQIEERIEKKKAQITKIEKRIAKWVAAKSDKGFKKEYSFMEQGGLYYNPRTQAYDRTYDELKAERWEDYAYNCDRELEAANRDLNEAQLQLEKYNNMLKLEQVKQAKLSSEKIQVIVDFLNNWQQRVTKYVHTNVKLIPKYYEARNKANNIYYMGWKEFSKEEIDKKYKEFSKEAKEIKELISDISFEVYDKDAKNLTDDKKLSDILGKEADNKYLKLVDSITAKVGEITDTSDLHIGLKGDIEGYITGTKGKVHIQTIGAGGYNIQCYHFRTLIKSIKN